MIDLTARKGCKASGHPIGAQANVIFLCVCGIDPSQPDVQAKKINHMRAHNLLAARAGQGGKPNLA